MLKKLLSLTLAAMMIVSLFTLIKKEAHKCLKNY